MSIYGNELSDLNFLSFIENSSYYKDYTYKEIVEILSITQNNLNQSLTESDISFINEAYDKRNKSFLDFCAAIGIRNEMIMETIIKYAKKIADQIRKEGLNASSREKIIYLKQDMAQEISKAYAYPRCDALILKLPNDVEYDMHKIYNSIIITLHVYITNSLISKILDFLCRNVGFYIGGAIANVPGATVGFLVGKFSADAITATLVAPIVEESAKDQAIKGGFELEFAFIFNMFELSLYVKSMVKSKIYSLIDAIKIRIGPVIMHLTTIVIQKLCTLDFIIKDLGFDPKKEEDRKKASALGKFVGELIHFIWNFTCILVSIPGLEQDLIEKYNMAKQYNSVRKRENSIQLYNK